MIVIAAINSKITYSNYSRERELSLINEFVYGNQQNDCPFANRDSLRESHLN